MKLFGVNSWKPDKSWAGFTLFTPMLMGEHMLEGEKESKVYLIDMNGSVVHHWKVPGVIFLHADLLPNGNIICGFKEPGQEPGVGTAFCISGVFELDWDSNIVWKYSNNMIDGHDRARLRNGNTVVFKYVKVPPEIQAKVKGGMPGTEIFEKGIAVGGDFGWRIGEEFGVQKKEGQMYSISLTEVTPEGKEVWEMPLYEALDPEIDILTPYCGRELWPGLNSIKETPDGNLISTSYNLSTVFMWDKKSKKVKWRFGNKGKNLISFPHDPSVLENGNVLFFENGRYYSSDPDGSTNYFPPDHSTVLEVNPNTNEIEWLYKAENPVDFYSTYISSARRLPNGNTLICEGATGRFFEVTRKGETVWEYISPFFHESNSRFGKTNAVFRCMRYGLEFEGFKDKVFDDAKNDKINRLFGPEAMKYRNQGIIR